MHKTIQALPRHISHPLKNMQTYGFKSQKAGLTLLVTKPAMSRLALEQ